MSTGSKDPVVTNPDAYRVIFENDEAYRFVGDAPVRKLIIKVTVEGGYFKNK